MKAFEEFFLGRARDVYPRYDFARMNEEEYEERHGRQDFLWGRA